MNRVARWGCILAIWLMIGSSFLMVRHFFEGMHSELNKKIEKVSTDLTTIERYLQIRPDIASFISKYYENESKIRNFSENLLKIVKNDDLGLDLPKKEDFDSETLYFVSLRAYVSRIPWLFPLDSYYISSGYGYRKDPITGKRAFHYGVDLATNRGERVISPLSGEVVHAGWKSQYGRAIVIRHGDDFTTLYGHLKRILVKKGQHVASGQTIGTVGDSGKSTGPHLHYEIKYKNKYKNPYYFLVAGKLLTNR